MADLAITPLETDGVAGGLGQLVENARAYAQSAMAPNTRRAYRADWADFTSWCASAELQPLPASAATIALYLTARAPHLAVSTLARRLAAIRRAHRAAGVAAADDERLHVVWSGIRRSHGRPPRRKRALVTEDLRRVVKKCPDTLIGIRDRAVLLLGFAAALRRSELAAVNFPGKYRENTGKIPGDAPIRLTFVAGGLEIHIDRSKGDQLGEGAVVGVPYGKTALCPVTAVRNWLDAANIATGPLFRSIDRHGSVGQAAISDKAIADIVKRACARAGLQPMEFGGHSLRAGLATSAAANDVALDVIMRQTRHAKVETTRGYIRDGERFKRNAAGKVGL